MSLLNIDHGLDNSSEWGQFVDIEDTAETKASRQSRFLSLFCFYNNGTSNTQKRRQSQSQSQNNGVPVDVKETSKHEAIEQPHEDLDDYDVDEDSCDSDSDVDVSDSDEDLSENEEVTKSGARYIPSTQANSKQKNASAIMKKLYRSVSVTKSKRSTMILPENVLQQDLESKQNAREEKESNMNPIEIVSKDCTKNEPQCGACSCVSCSPNSVEVPTCTGSIAHVTGRMLDIATDNQRKISLSLSEAADILVALHPKASKDHNVARKLKIQFEKADESKQKQVVSRLPRDKLLSLLSTIRAQS